MPNRRGDTKNQEGNANEEVGDEREDQDDGADKEHQEEEEDHEGHVNHNTICDGCDNVCPIYVPQRKINADRTRQSTDSVTSAGVVQTSITAPNA